MRVLVVEDELLIARSVCEYLTEINAEPLNPVQSGEMAIKVALEKEPDLILMDIRIKGNMNGIEAARIIRKKLFVPIIFMTGYATAEIKEQALAVDLTDFVEKPLSLYSLKSIINRIMDP